MDTYTGMPMAITGELLAKQYNLSREDCDNFAFRSQKRWKDGILIFISSQFSKFLCASAFSNVYRTLSKTKIKSFTQNNTVVNL